MCTRVHPRPICTCGALPSSLCHDCVLTVCVHLGLPLQANENVLMQLKDGELDLCVATAMAEEGLDIIQCQMVLRFDLPKRAGARLACPQFGLDCLSASARMA